MTLLFVVAETSIRDGGATMDGTRLRCRLMNLERKAKRA
jgi:hypothetical protein